MKEEEELKDILSRGGVPGNGSVWTEQNQEARPVSPYPPGRTDVDYSLWQVLPNGRFRPGAKTQPKIPAGVYRIQRDDLGLFLVLIQVLSDEIVELPDESHSRVLEGIRKFWGSSKKYKKHGLVYKRGILLWGPPGGGKTVTSQLLSREIISKHNGVVILCEEPTWTVEILRTLRMIERDRPIIVILEDIDEIMAKHGEHDLLALLDGEHQVDNVVYLATTNFPDRLGARIVNRPSRFDERIKIGMPSMEARAVYLKKALGNMDNKFIEKWAKDTEGFSIAHLRELVVAVMCLDQEYTSVVERLRAMEIRPKDNGDGFRKRSISLQQRA